MGSVLIVPLLHSVSDIYTGINKFHIMWRCVVGWLVSDVPKDGRTCLFKGNELPSGTVSYFFYHGATALVGQGLLIMEDSWSYSDTPHSVGLLWTSDQPYADTSTWQHSQETDIHAPGGIGIHNPSKRAAADPSLRSKLPLPVKVCCL